MSSKFKVNDEVLVISGKDKGKIGIIKSILNKYKVIVDGVNICYKNVKSSSSGNILGGIIKREFPIHISNISHFYEDGIKSKIGYKFLNNKKVRFIKKNKLVF